MSNKLDKITGHLGYDYAHWKKHGADKEARRLEFFALATEAIRERGLSTETRTIYGPSKEEAESRAVTYYPAHRVLEIEEDKEGKWKLILEELPEFKPFTYVNHGREEVFKRSITKGSLQLDDALLKERDLDLYMRVTEFPQWVDDLAENYQGIYDYAFEKVPRTLKNFNDIDQLDLALLKEYMYESAPQVKLAAPRKAKPEELDDE